MAYTLKIHAIFLENGIPIEYKILPGRMHDKQAPYEFNWNFQGEVLADRGYNDEETEEILSEIGVKLNPIRKKKHKKQDDWLSALCNRKESSRNILFSVGLIGRIHAVTQEGFLIKIKLGMLAEFFNFYVRMLIFIVK